MQNNLDAHEAAFYKLCLKERVAPDEIIQRGFGLLPPKHPILIKLAENLAAGQELWHFSAPAEDWENMIGESGVAIVRDDEVIAVFVLLHN